MDRKSVERRAFDIQKNLFDSVNRSLKNINFSDDILNQLMSECMSHDGLRTQLLRFIDVFPVLKTDRQIVRHFLSYVGNYKQYLPLSLSKILRLTDKPIMVHVAAITIRRMVKIFAGHFIIDSLKKSKVQKTGTSLRKRGFDVTWDILGEESLTKEEADDVRSRYLDLIEGFGSNLKFAGFTENVSVKLSSLVPKFQWDPINFKECSQAVGNKFAELLRAGMKCGVDINVDMEQYAFRDLTLNIFKQTLERKEFKNIRSVGIVVQSYLRDSEDSLDDLLAWIKKTGTRTVIRLVKGAYWDYEVINAEYRHWPKPVFSKKALTDKQFKKLAEKILIAKKSGIPVTLAAGSHNIESISYIMAMTEELGVKDAVEFQVLYGMGDHVREAIKNAGYLVRVYTPYGELIPSMAYLVRRLLENTSQQSFLGINFINKNENKNDLKERVDLSEQDSDDGSSDRIIIPAGFRPHSVVDFARKKNRLAMKYSIKKISAQPVLEYPIFLRSGGQVSECLKIVRNPANLKGKEIGLISCSSIQHADLAMRAAHKSFDLWNGMPVQERASMLQRAAEIMRDAFFDLAALQISEVSKTWREACADVAEAIDFLEYYSRVAVNIMIGASTEKLAEESNRLEYHGRGVSVVISPWNFPMAIAAGMCSAALVCGNTVVFKPASTASVSGARLVKIFRDAGIPDGVINFVPGSGNELGEYLVKHPHTTNILFTGSKDVGFNLIKWAAEADYSQKTHQRRVIAEMGGKNAIIVDESADLDQAVYGIVQSAFGFQGQKCSASSRVIVIDSIYDEFMKRLVGTTASLKTGNPKHPGTDLGAVIDEKSFNKIRRYIEIGKKESELAYEGVIDATDGWFVGPVIFANVKPKSVVAQEEIFGPVLAIIRAKDFSEALSIANDSCYHLTGGIYSRTDENISLAKKFFSVGNLYINRNITGAIVGRQPFGGFGASGTGPKAGGPDYLLPLMEARHIAENLMRRGFSSELKN